MHCERLRMSPWLEDKRDEPWNASDYLHFVPRNIESNAGMDFLAESPVPHEPKKNVGYQDEKDSQIKDPEAAQIALRMFHMRLNYEHLWGKIHPIIREYK